MAFTQTLLDHVAQPENRPYLVVLVHIMAAGNSVYFSTQAYTPDGTAITWQDCLINDIVSESSLDTHAAVADFEVAGVDWPRNDLNYFDGADCLFWLGDVRWGWGTSQFEAFAPSIIEQIIPINDNHWRVELTEIFPELLAQMTCPLQGTIPTPIGFGSIRNAEPVLIDPATLTYSLGFNTPCTNVSVMDNGVVIAGWSYISTVAGAAGSNIRLTNAPAGRITVDFDTPQVVTLQQVLYWVLNYAGAYIPLASIPDRLIGFASTAIMDDVKPTVWVADPTKMAGADLLNEVLTNNDMHMRRNSVGNLEFVYLDFYNIAALPIALTVDRDDIIADSLKVVRVEPAHQKITLRYAKNQTVQTGGDLAGSVSVANRLKYGKAYFYEDTVSTSAPTSALFASTYRKDLTLDSATREQNRLKAQYSLQRRVYALALHSALGLQIKEGDVIEVSDPLVSQPEIGLARCFVVAVKQNITTLVTELEILEASYV